eukprot:1151186-Pelagomonas_calceolata.AAC.14
MAGLVACRLYASSAALAHMCATSPHAAGAAGTAMCQGVQQRPPKATPDADQGGQVQTLEGAVQGLLGLMEVADAAGLANADDLAWACSYLASAGGWGKDWVGELDLLAHILAMHEGNDEEFLMLGLFSAE